MKKDLITMASQFSEVGFLSPITVYSDDEIKSYQSSFAEFEENINLVREDYENLHFHASWARELATHPLLLNLIEAIIGPEILIYGTLILSKIPGQKSHLSWHQDQYFLKHKKHTPYVTAWIALTNSTIENGCMKMIPKSNKNGIQPHLPFTRDDTNLLTRGEEIKITPNQNDIFDNVLNPGQISIHDGAVIHSSSPNLTNKKRIGFIARYVTPDIESTQNPVLQVRGNKSISHLKTYDKLPFTSVSESINSYQN